MPRAKRTSQGSLTIVGLGPGDWNDVTIAAQTVLEAAPAITFRTLRHPTVATLRERRPDLTITTFDDLYEQAEDWDTLYDAMATQLLQAAMTAPVVYAVPGHPAVGETSVRRLRQLAATRSISLRLVAGLSFLEPICITLGLDPLEHGLQLVDATELVSLAPQQVAGAVTPTRPLLVSQIYNRRMASSAKLALLELYPADWQVTLVQAAGLPEERVRQTDLSAIDHDDFPDHLTSLFLPAVPAAALQVDRSPEALRYVVARLRAADGCPWDREQTHQSLLPFVLEEAAEVADAIEEFADDPMHLAEELGDLLLQVYLHSEIAQEEEAFSLGDVYAAITRKLIRRHPHVFGTTQVSGADQVVQNWEVIKRAERAADGQSADFESRLKRTPRHLAALTNAQATQRRAAKAGFDWPSFDEWVTKLDEEVRELRAAATAEEQADEFGDLLFTVVALARRLDIGAEEALRAATEKFRRRFERMEILSQQRGLTFETLDHTAQLALWHEAKQIATTPSTSTSTTSTDE